MTINRRDLEFILYELLQCEELCETGRFVDYDRNAFDAVLDTAYTLAADRFAPLAATMDANEPEFRDGKVVLPEGVREALEDYIGAGFLGAGFDLADGGMQLPGIISFAVSSIFAAANISLSGYAGLTRAATNLLITHGSDSQKQTFLEPMLSGRYFGTMCLSEPHAGSSLSDIRTKATKTADGDYLIEGSKMWISAGDHELSENIIHFVIARIDGAPSGTRGISLFIVPKYRVGPDSSVGESNNIALAGLNHKMGSRGTVNCLLNFGESGDCRGYLVGEENHGLACMFHMMNEMRIGVGLAAVSLGYAGYIYSLDYARNRPQGRHPQDKDPNSPQVMIIEHADIRRLLMWQKVYAEGGLALALYCARLLDDQAVASDEDERRRLGLLLDILTPIVKSWPSEFCLEANKHAIQVLGGYGYTREYPVERLYRDNRLNAIHEGTHGIHGLDLLGRKVRMLEGTAFKLLIEEIRIDIRKAAATPDLQGHAADLTDAIQKLVETTLALTGCGNLNLSLSNATPYLDAMGNIVIAWMWLKQAQVANRKLREKPQEDTGSDFNFYTGKISACHFFFTYKLPVVLSELTILARLDDSLLKMTEEAYLGT
ncbi:acyl-CoA dehydrogenase [Emcibacter nanhaiensis]|uniref:Acyl-CoA dehydrogenase n=1 Tax=Emcibacter nanhaiensis TaxID=1505037 RepID=A0A501PGF3_9PROT|nr:acyl-CoA dehydrogenase [Emcibacter nanhaiensis]TPD59275.1 acyl-CoA dehydrogenase [Emcibacter nanhaiensis]